MTTSNTSSKTNANLVDAHTMSKFQKAMACVKNGAKLDLNNPVSLDFAKRAKENKINGSSYLMMKKQYGVKLDDLINNIALSMPKPVITPLEENQSFIESNYNPNKKRPVVATTDIKSLNWIEKTVKFPEGRGTDSTILTGVITKVYTAGGVDRCMVKSGDQAPVMKRISTILKYNS